jgi:hypothetical protein
MTGGSQVSARRLGCTGSDRAVDRPERCDPAVRPKTEVVLGGIFFAVQGGAHTPPDRARTVGQASLDGTLEERWPNMLCNPGPRVPTVVQKRSPPSTEKEGKPPGDQE